jgi:hypothetical protein
MVFLKMAVFWVLAPCSLVEVYRRFRGACCLHHQGDREIGKSFLHKVIKGVQKNILCSFIQNLGINTNHTTAGDVRKIMHNYVINYVEGFIEVHPNYLSLSYRF